MKDEEEKSNEIPLVVASERARGQTEGSNTIGVRTAYDGRTFRRTAWEGSPQRVTDPYPKDVPS